MRSGLIASAAVIGLLVALPAAAHHGSASFDTGKRVVLKGTVTEWLYSNPHCLLKIDVKGDDGKVVPWIAEGQAPNVIFPAGYRRDTFKYGDQVTITVEPFKDGRSIGRILQTVLADGRTLGVASSAPAAAAAAPQP
ncbi:MAG: hypothetical protein HY824_09425 [Acidobacteria bacterium]|nr:hypothetical protein [Acidobacteriota bacterium]